MIQVIQNTFRKFGIEIKKFMPGSSAMGSMQALIAYNRIDLVLDVGANVGQYARMLRACGYRGRIVSFEPLSSAHETLLKLSKCDPLWEIATRMALGAEDGDVEINVSANSVSSSIVGMLDTHVQSVPASRYVSRERVPLKMLDSVAPQYIEGSRDIFLKIDTQGFELQVLQGAHNLLPQIKGLQLELSLVPLYEGETMYLEMISNINALGFDLHGLFSTFTDVTTGRMLQADGVFFRTDRT